MRLSFKFKDVDIGDHLHAIRRPIIPVTLSSAAGKSIDIEAFIDSGSDNTVIPKDIADFLELELGKKTDEIALGGEKFKAALWHVHMTVTDGRETVRLPDIVVSVPIEGGTVLEEVLIGREPFFRDFDITFRQNSNRIILERVRRA